MTRFQRSAAATLALACSMLAPVVASAGNTNGRALVQSNWSCTGSLNGDEVFMLPAVAVSPGAGAFKAPFPGFLATDGTTYVVLATGLIGSPVPVGRKSGLHQNVSDCVSTDFGAEVLIAPAA